MAHVHTPLVPHVESNDTRRAWIALAITPLAVVVAFVLGSILLGDPNASDAPTGWDGAWRAALVWVGACLAPALAAYWGLRAVRADDARGATPGMIGALVFVLLTSTTLLGGLLAAL